MGKKFWQLSPRNRGNYAPKIAVEIKMMSHLPRMASLLLLCFCIVYPLLICSYSVWGYVGLLLGILILLLRLLLLAQSCFPFWHFDASQERKTARKGLPIATIQIHASLHLQRSKILFIKAKYSNGIRKIAKTARNVARTQMTAKVTRQPLIIAHLQGENRNDYYKLPSMCVNSGQKWLIVW
jgi:hypothetical protein